MMNLELLGIFLGGMALNATPCVYPLIPVTVAYFAARGLEDERSNAARAAHAALYVAGLAVMNSFLGVLAALTGGLVGSALQSPVLLIFVAGTLLFLAAGLFGFWELRVPTPLSRLSTRTFTGYFGSFFMGLTLGLVAAPCIGPFVLGLLTWVAASGDPRLGFLVFFTLSLGLGLPQFFLAVFSGQIHRLPRSGYWMVWIRKLLGWTLVGMAAYFLLPLLGDTVGWMLMAATVLFGGLHLALVGKDEVVGRRFRLVRSLAGAGGVVLAAAILVSWVFVKPGVQWQPYSEQAIQEAVHANKPVVMDFYAAWCAPCRAMEKDTFGAPSIVKEAENFVMIKVDLTRREDPAHRELAERFGVKGVPTVVFLDRKGEELRGLRVEEYMGPGAFLARMARAR